MQGATPWPEGKLRRASVNSFGYGGANAHTILESIECLAPGRGGVKARADGDGCSSLITANGDKSDSNRHTNMPYGINDSHVPLRHQFLLAFSAHTELTLKHNVAAIQECAERYSILDLAYTLGCRRSKFASRTYVIASQDTIMDVLDAEDLRISKAIGARNLSLGFVFTGTCSSRE